MGYDFKTLKENTDILAVIERYETLKKDGPHYRMCCPFHNEDTASLVVTPKKNIWKCFGCGKGGDVFDFLTNYGYTYKEAVALVQGNDPGYGVAFPVKKLDANVKAPTVWKQDIPRAQPTIIEHYRYGQPHHYWPYYNEHGTIISYDCRFDHADGTKDVLPLTYCTDGSNGQWRWQGMDKPRTLSHMDLLKQHPEKSVVIVEGRKTREAAQRLLPNPIALTWQGGGKAVRFTDWSILKGRKVTIWQDNDFAGYMTSIEIAELLKEYADIIRFVHNPDDAVKGWDAADAEAEGWTPEHTRDYVIKNAYDTPQKREKPPKPVEQKANSEVQETKSGKEPAGSQLAPGNTQTTPTLVLADGPGVSIPIAETNLANQNGANSNHTPSSQSTSGNYGSTQAVDDSNLQASPYFRFLGFQSTDGAIRHCFYNVEKKVIVKMSASAMAKQAGLIELAPLAFWEQTFYKKEGFNIAAAVNWLILTSGRFGIFNPQNIRGRGAWVDDGNIVVHAGNYMVINGQSLDLSNYRGRYIYEQGAGLGFNPSNPLKAEEASQFLDLTNMLKWERGINGYLLAGWCVIASVCGALRWRPHIWITGGAGSGKTWVLDNIVKPMLGDTSLCVQGSTSEAGLRQALRRDALPVVFDEAEGENKNDQERMQSVLSLMRSASSEDGGNIIKGTAASGADSYQIRSCFAFASIALQLSQQSDRSRITILSLNTPTGTPEGEPVRKKHFDNLIFTQYNLITKEYCQRLQARTIQMLPTILKNAHTFAAAAASTLGQQRAGDQLGALLAGAYSLRSNGLVSYDAALKWLSDKDWTEEKSLSEMRDERNLFGLLMDSQVRVEGAFSTYNRTVGELIRVFLDLDTDEHVAHGSAEMSLRRFGIVIDKMQDRIYVSNNAKELKKALENTPWSRNHNNLLARIPGAERKEGIRFGSGVTQRSVSIPLAYFID